jgi:hypothetical protein
LSSDNHPTGQLTPVRIEFASPPHHVTSLATATETLMLAGVDGNVVVLTHSANGWHESSRWKQWGLSDSNHFGAEISLTVDEGHLWIADTQRARVLCFDLNTKKLLAASNPADQVGDDDHHLHGPTVIAARHRRAVVFDSTNQRLVKLRLLDTTK